MGVRRIHVRLCMDQTPVLNVYELLICVGCLEFTFPFALV